LAYLKPFFQISVINIFFLGALFYCVAALSRRIVVVYLQGASVLELYLSNPRAIGSDHK
jgi:ABC-2 type transport system permease protein